MKVRLEAPYLLMLGDVAEANYAKTALGIAQWKPDLVRGQLRFPTCAVDLGIPDMTVAEAANAGVRSLIIGVAPIGGSFPDSWWSVVEEAADAGLDIVSGMHGSLSDHPDVLKASRRSGARLIDVRHAPNSLPIASGARRTGKRLLTVGTDCAVGKKYSALAIDAALSDAAIPSTFRATGQTGIMIAGAGIPIDAVVSDFVAGAAELVSPDNDDDHWDVIEGQGSLFHPAYAGVALGLLHGSQPDAIVVCHAAGRREISGWDGFTLPSLQECIERHLEAARLTNPGVRCVGICVNTSSMDEPARKAYLARIADEHGIPCVDPVATGCKPVVNELVRVFC